MIQLLRDWPPGFGGVERYAHEIASELEHRGESLITVACVPLGHKCTADPLPVKYVRNALWCIDIARLRLPIPQLSLLKLLIKSEPLLVHLPCPTLALLTWIALLFRPNRRVWIVWHAFLEGHSFGHRIYSRLLRTLLPRCAHISTTSPVLADSLASYLACSPDRISVLPCVLADLVEDSLLVLGQRRLKEQSRQAPYTLVCIGRLDTYKRVDWVLRAFIESPADCLEIVGDGPRRVEFEKLAQQLNINSKKHIKFHGRLDEHSKWAILASSHLLILAADSCHEAFGIVQLEAMAAAVPSISFELPNSGMAWVNGLNIAPFLPMRCQSDLDRAIQYYSSFHEQRTSASFAYQRYLKTFSRSHWLIQLNQWLGRWLGREL